MSKEKKCPDCGTYSLCKATGRPLIVCESYSVCKNKEDEQPIPDDKPGYKTKEFPSKNGAHVLLNIECDKEIHEAFEEWHRRIFGMALGGTNYDYISMLESYGAGRKSAEEEIKELENFKKAFYPLLESSEMANKQREAEIKRLKKERDLAIAHDNQDYPTVEAYEKVCEISFEREKEIEELKHIITLKEMEGV